MQLFIHDPKHAGMFFASSTHGSQLYGSGCFQCACCFSFTQVFLFFSPLLVGRWCTGKVLLRMGSVIGSIWSKTEENGVVEDQERRDDGQTEVRQEMINCSKVHRIPKNF